MRNQNVILLAGLLLLTAVRVEAQRRRGLVDVTPRHDRHGAWIHLGLGAGSEAYRFSDQADYNTDSPTKPSFSLRVGGTLNPHIRLGGELMGWADTFNDDQGNHVTEYLGGLMLVGQFYPARRAGFFVKGGGGFSRSGVRVSGGYNDTHEDGFAWTVGAGYEIQLSRALFITPTVDLMQHRSEARNQPALYERLAMLGVALTIQPGR